MEVMIFCYKHTDKQTLHHYIYIIIIIMEDGARIPLVMSLITNILSCFAKADREPNKLPTANPNTFSTANNTL